MRDATRAFPRLKLTWRFESTRSLPVLLGGEATCRVIVPYDIAQLSPITVRSRAADKAGRVLRYAFSSVARTRIACPGAGVARPCGRRCVYGHADDEPGGSNPEVRLLERALQGEVRSASGPQRRRDRVPRSDSPPHPAVPACVWLTPRSTRPPWALRSRRCPIRSPSPPRMAWSLSTATDDEVLAAGSPPPAHRSTSRSSRRPWC